MIHKIVKKWGNYSNVNFKFTGWYSNDYGKNYQYGENKSKEQYNMILSTGASERNKSNNIYDLSGNIMEYMDVFKEFYKGKEMSTYIAMGGYYDNISTYTITHALSVDSPNSKQGFRVVLFNE